MLPRLPRGVPAAAAALAARLTRPPPARRGLTSIAVFPSHYALLPAKRCGLQPSTPPSRRYPAACLPPPPALRGVCLRASLCCKQQPPAGLRPPVFAQKKKKESSSESQEEKSEPKAKSEKCEKKSRNFRVIPALEKSREEILKVIKMSFYRSEPLMAALGFVGTRVPQQFDDYILIDLEEDLSLLATGCIFDEIRGFAINASITPYRKPADPEVLRRVGPCGRTLLKIWEFLEVESDLTTCFKQEKVFEVRYIGTHPEYLRQGIAKELTIDSLKLAKKRGYKVASMFCTSMYSKYVAEAAGMDAVWCMAWAKYKDHRGIQVVTPKHPHTHVYVMAKVLCDDSNSS